MPLEDHPEIVLLPLPHAVPADPAAPVTVRFAVTHRDGRPWPDAKPSVRVTAGTLTGPVPEQAPGVFACTWTPPTTDALAAISVEDQGTAATAKVKVVPPLSQVALSASPDPLPTNRRDVTVTATVHRGDTHLLGRKPTLTILDGAPAGPLVDHRNGTWSERVRRSQDRVRIAAEPSVEPTGLPPARLVAWTDRTSARADGIGTVTLSVAAVDALGLPVPGVDLALSVASGGGIVPPTARTNAGGVARVDYRLGNDAGPVVLHAEGAGLAAETVLFAWTDAEPPVPLADAGSPSTLQARAMGRETAPVLSVWVSGKAPPEAPLALPTAGPRPAPNPHNAAVTPPAPTARAPTSSEGSPPPASPPRATRGPRAQPPRPSTTGSGPRFTLSLASVPRIYSATSTASDIPSNASYQHGNLFAGRLLGAGGMDARALDWLADGPVGIEVHGLAYLDPVRVGDQHFNHLGWNLNGAVRVRHPLGSSGWTGYGLGGLQAMNALYFKYTDAAMTGAKAHSASLWGPRIGGGVMAGSGMVHADVQVAEAFAFAPAATSLDLGIDFGDLPHGLAIDAGIALDLRYLKIDADGETVRVHDQAQAVIVGVTKVL